MKFVRLATAIILLLAITVSLLTLEAHRPAQATDNTSDNTTVNLEVEVVPRRRGAGGGGGIPIYYIDTDLFGVEDRYRISRSGELRETIEDTSEIGMITLTVAKGTSCLDKDGKRLRTLEVGIDESPPPPPEDADIIGLVYDFGPEGATFDPPVELLISYDPEELPENVSSVFIAYYDEEQGWLQLEPISGFVAAVGTATAEVSHFTTFAIIGTVRLPSPAAFAVTDLSILPAEVYVGDSLSITVIVTNTGGQLGSYEVTLKTDDVIEATKEVTVSPGLSKKVTFTVSKDIPSIYLVDVDGLTASFIVKVKAVPPVLPPAKPFPWPLVGGIIAAVVAAAVITFFLIRWRRPVIKI